MHEYRPQAEKRFEDMGWPVRNGELRYYGSADGTSWFLVVLDALGDDALTEELSGAWRAAAQWLQRALERGDGMVRHGPRLASGGLVQQGWRDTTDPLAAYGGGILDADGDDARAAARGRRHAGGGGRRAARHRAPVRRLALALRSPTARSS